MRHPRMLASPRWCQMSSFILVHYAHRFFRHSKMLQTGVIDRIILSCDKLEDILDLHLGGYVYRENLVWMFHRTLSVVGRAVRSYGITS